MRAYSMAMQLSWCSHFGWQGQVFKREADLDLASLLYCCHVGLVRCSLQASVTPMQLTSMTRGLPLQGRCVRSRLLLVLPPSCMAGTLDKGD